MNEFAILKKQLKKLLMIFSILCFIACSKDNEYTGNNENNEESTESYTTSGQIEGIDINNCWLSTTFQEVKLEKNTFKIQSNNNNCVQTFIVRNDKDEILLMARVPLAEGETILIDAQSTALAMITWHPLFSPIKNDKFQELVDAIANSPKYQIFYNEVAKAINSNRNLYDETNETLISALGNLIDDLFSDFINENGYATLIKELDSSESINTKAIYNHPQINPTYIDAQINDNKLSLRTIWMTPRYYGTITKPNGTILEKEIPSRDDFGVLDIISNRTTRGQPMEFTFEDEGGHQFYFSRINEKATFDFYAKIASGILSTLGISSNPNDNIIIDLSNAITSVLANVTDGNITTKECLVLAYEASLDQLSKGSYFGYDIKEQVATFCKYAAKTLFWYNKIKGAANLALRLAYAFKAPETFSFCLCYYNNEVTTCTEASLFKVSGDEQIGNAYQTLPLPLTVYVQTLGDDGVYYEPSEYHRVKFEVISGNGYLENDLVAADENKQASTYWTLGDEEEQKVRAVVVDIITEEEISESVYFTAKVETSEERKILIELYQSTNGDNWINNTNWCSNKPLNEWYGITLNEEGYIQSISLENNNLDGVADIHGLVYLNKLDLSNNPLTELSIQETALKTIALNNCITKFGNVHLSGISDINVSNCNEIGTISLDGCQTLTTTNCNFGENTGFNGTVHTALIENCQMFNCSLNADYFTFRNSTTTDTWYAVVSTQANLINSYCSTICYWDFQDGCSLNVSNTTFWRTDWQEEQILTVSFSCVMGGENLIWNSIF